MWSGVVTCREAGHRLRRAELPTPVSAYLFVLDFDGRHNKFRRHLRFADLKAPEPPHPTSLLLPLFSPELVSLHNGKMLLGGVEQCVDGDTVYEVQQMWMVEPLPWVRAVPRHGLRQVSATSTAARASAAI